MRNFREELAAFCRTAEVTPDIARSVAGILGDVRNLGDDAVATYAARFDGVQLKPKAFRVKPAELTAAARKLAPAERKAVKTALDSIVRFNKQGLPKDWSGKNSHGARVGEKFDPLRRVGVYVPGGQVPLVSTALMTVALAKIAGCPEIAAFTPSGRDGKVAPPLLAALKLAGATEVYRIGGVQAIGAMAFGTATIPAVDKIFGPGNAYVCEAKRQVFGRVGVDSLPGPSELMVIADETANPEFAAADLLAQAEHGSGREKLFLVSSTQSVIASIAAEMVRQMPNLSRSARVSQVLADGFLSIWVKSPAQAAEVANAVAPEHLELLVSPAAANRLTKLVTTAGAIMIGNHTPTALGDFTAGPSHVLPTGGAGRFFSGLRVPDFLRRTSIIQYDKASVRRAEPTVAAFAAMEHLDAHGESVRKRVKSGKR